jgi:tetratricopeptide (TPR) repeat protein
MGYKGKQMPLRAIARELGVQGIVEGSVMREGGQVRITARLIDGRTDRRLWDSTYNRQMAGILALYSEVARTIAGNIGATLTPEEARRLQVVRTVNPQAYDEFLLGRREAMLWTSTGFPRAIVHYRRAIALDSTFADPHAGLVDAYWGLALIGDLSPKASASLAEAEAERAVALDPASARAHLALAQVRSNWQWRWEDADREFLRALELNPGLSDLYVTYVTVLTGLGRHDESVRRALRAVALDPLQAAAWSQLGWAYFYAGRLQESIAAEDSALRRTPSFPVAHMVRSWAYSALGRHPEAVAAVDSALAGDSLYQPVMGSAALVYARAGRPAESRRHLDALLSLGRTKWVDPYNVGWAYAWLGETDRALAAFSRAADELSPSLFGLKVEFLPERFKADPRFHALLRRIRLE